MAVVRDVVQRREPRSSQECVLVLPPSPPYLEPVLTRRTPAAIDLCNNPATHEPKLQRARRLLPEWSEYDDEVAALAKRILANDSTASSSSAAAFRARAHELEQAVQQEQERESFVEEQQAQAVPAPSGRVKDEL